MHIYVMLGAAVRKYAFFTCISLESFSAIFIALAHCGSSGRRNMCRVFGVFASLVDTSTAENCSFVSAACACSIFSTLFTTFGGPRFRTLFTAFPPEITSEWLWCHFRCAGGFELDAI